MKFVYKISIAIVMLLLTMAVATSAQNVYLDWCSPAASNVTTDYLLYDSGDTHANPTDYWNVTNWGFVYTAIPDAIWGEYAALTHQNSDEFLKVHNNVGANVTYRFQTYTNYSKHSASTYLSVGDISKDHACGVKIDNTNNNLYYLEVGAWTGFSTAVPDESKVNVSMYHDGTTCRYYWKGGGSSQEKHVTDYAGHDGTVRQMFVTGEGSAGNTAGTLDCIHAFEGNITPQTSDTPPTGKNATNITLYLYSKHKQTALNRWEVMVNNNGQWHQVYTGNIVINWTNVSGVVQLDVNAFNFQSQIYNHNPLGGGGTWKGNVTLIPPTQSAYAISINNTAPLTTQDVLITCNYSVDPISTNYTVTTEYHWNNTEDNRYRNATNNTLNIQRWDFQDPYMFWCRYYVDPYRMYWGNKTANISADTIDTNCNVTMYDSKQNVVTTAKYVDMYTNTTWTGSPVTILLSTLINRTHQNRTLKLNVTDTSGIHRDRLSYENITHNTTSINITLQPNKLTIYFSFNNTYKNVTGQIADMNKTRYFDNSTIVIVQRSLAEGLVQVRFNGNSSWAGYTQFYEYDNDYNLHVSENLTVLQRADWSAYIKVTDYMGSRIENAQVRAQTAYPTAAAAAPFQLYTQRLVQNADGTVLIYADSETIVKLTVSKDGYEPQIRLLSIGDDSFTQDEPLEIRLNLDANNLYGDNKWTTLSQTAWNFSEWIFVGVSAPGADGIEFITSYMESQGMSRAEAHKDAIDPDNWRIVLKPNTHFLPGQTTITLKIYDDYGLGFRYWKTLTLNKQDTTVYNRFNITSTIDTSILNILLAVALILAAVAVGAAFKNTNAGFMTFMVGSIFVSFISTQFLWLSVTSAMFFVLKITRKVFSE